ncbi:MAG: hypothetical protein IKZ07_03730 [Akkermansia sp.]|nr:hypothetical protein [Akkermansia sp.]
MIKGKYSIDTRRMRAKIRQWERQVDAVTLADLKLYGQTAAKAMMKCTPPGNMKERPAVALRKLKERIKKDFEGDGLKSFDDDDIFWYRDGRGTLRARIGGYTDERPSPFRVIRGRASKKMQEAMKVGGRHKVEFVAGGLSEFMRRAGQYYMGRRGSTYRLKWHGVRHVTTMAAVRGEIRSRQRLAGKLMAGWKPLAHAAGTKLPSAVEKQSGKGSAKIRHSMLHKAVLEGRNAGHYPELQGLVNRQVPWILKRNRSIAKRRAKQLGKKLKK